MRSARFPAQAAPHYGTLGILDGDRSRAFWGARPARLCAQAACAERSCVRTYPPLQGVLVAKLMGGLWRVQVLVSRCLDGSARNCRRRSFKQGGSPQRSRRAPRVGNDRRAAFLRPAWRVDAHWGDVLGLSAPWTMRVGISVATPANALAEILGTGQAAHSHWSDPSSTPASSGGVRDETVLPSAIVYWS